MKDPKADFIAANQSRITAIKFRLEALAQNPKIEDQDLVLVLEALKLAQAVRFEENA